MRYIKDFIKSLFHNLKKLSTENFEFWFLMDLRILEAIVFKKHVFTKYLPVSLLSFNLSVCMSRKIYGRHILRTDTESLIKIQIQILPEIYCVWIVYCVHRLTIGAAMLLLTIFSIFISQALANRFS